MSKKIKIEKSRRTVAGWLSTWPTARRELLCTQMVSDELIVLKEKPALLGHAQYLSHAIGEYARNRLAIDTIMLTLCSKENVMPEESLFDATRRLVNVLSDSFYEQENKPWRRYMLTKILKQELNKLVETDMIDKTPQGLRLQPIVPELLIMEHFGRVLHYSCGKSSWKRCVTSGVVGISPGIIFHEVPTVIRHYYSGREYPYKDSDLDKWWNVHGSDGSMFALRNNGYVFLQYNKRRFDKPLNHIAPPMLQSILKTVKALPFITTDMLVDLFGSENYIHFLDVLRRYPEATPLKIGNTFVPQGLAYMLQLGMKTDLTEHPTSTMVASVYKQYRPRFKEIDEFSATLKQIAHILAVDGEYTGKVFCERGILRSLETLGLIQHSGSDKYVVKPGMHNAVANLSKFVGNIFER